MMLLAAAVSFTACNNGGEEVTPTDPNDPTVVVTLDEEELYPDAFMAKVVTTNAERAAWKVVAHDEPVVVANVLAEGVQIPAGELNNAEVPALVLAEDLLPATAYDLYVAVEGNGKQVLSAPLCVTTAEAEALGSVVEFYVDNSMGGGNVEVGGMSLDMFNQPGQYITISAYGEDGETLEYSASLIMFDHDYADFGCTSYSYLTGHHYPVVAGSFDMGTFPTTSALMADPGYTNFTVNGKTYFPVVPTAEADAEGNPYGVSVITLVPNGQDLNMLEFNLPVVDEDNNEYVLVGSYMGPIGYQLSKPKYPFDLEEFGYTEFVATQEGSIITLTRDTIQGKLEMAFDISHNDNVFAAEADAEQGVTYVAGEGNNWSGYYFMPGLDEATYYFNEGSRIALFKTATEGEYRISVGRTLEGGSSWTMSSESSSYDYEVPIGDYTIKVTGLGGGSDTPAAAYTYNLVTAAPADWTGTYVVGGKVADGTLTYLDSKNPSTYATTYFLTSTIAVENNTIASDEAVAAIEVAKVEGTEYYSIKFGEEYVGWTSGNYAAFQTTAPTSADGGFLWTPSYTSDNLVKFTLSIKDGTNDRLFQYNDNNARFSVYKDTSNQADVMLYALAK